MQHVLSIFGYLAMFVLVTATLNFLGCPPLKETCWGGAYQNPYYEGARK